MMIYQEEPVTYSLLEELTPMLEQHWEEVAVNKDRVPLDINYDGYVKLYNSGILKLFTVRNEVELIGYYATMLVNHFHYKSTLFAMNDVVYVKPEYRGKLAGYKLLKFAEDKLKEYGVDVVSVHIKLTHDFSPMMERMGYQTVEKICTKYIGGD